MTFGGTGGGGSGTIGGQTDVALSNPVNDQVLTYNSTTGKWENKVVAPPNIPDGSVTLAKLSTSVKASLTKADGAIQNADVNDEDSVLRTATDALYAPVSVTTQINSVLRVVYHGSTAGAVRPTGLAPVMWVGTVQPTNLAAGDIYAESTPISVVTPWSPTDITTLNGWYDPTQLALSNGAAVSSWSDRSPFARALTVNSEAPTYSTTGLGGHPAVSFATSTVGLLETGVFTDTSTSPLTFFFNYQPSEVTSASHTMIGAASATDLSLQTRSAAAGYTLRRTNTDLTVSTTLVAGTSYTIVAVLNGSTSAFYQNGNSLATGTTGTGGITKIRIGRRGDGQNRFQGLIGDIFWMTGSPDTNTLNYATQFLTARRGA